MGGEEKERKGKGEGREREERASHTYSTLGPAKPRASLA